MNNQRRELSQLWCCSKCPHMRRIESFPLWQQTENEPHDQWLAVNFSNLGFWQKHQNAALMWVPGASLKATVTLLHLYVPNLSRGLAPWEALLQEPGFQGWPFSYHVKRRQCSLHHSVSVGSFLPEAEFGHIVYLLGFLSPNRESWRAWMMPLCMGRDILCLLTPL